MQLLTDPHTIFQRLIEDINAAQSIILMEFYIVYPKGQVLEVIEALSAAAQRGIECHILADSVGSFSFFNSSAHRTLEKAGVFVHQSLPVGLFKTLFKRSDLRNHRKIVVIDEHIGYIGSFNLVDPRFLNKIKTLDSGSMWRYARPVNTLLVLRQPWRSWWPRILVRKTMTI